MTGEVGDANVDKNIGVSFEESNDGNVTFLMSCWLTLCQWIMQVYPWEQEVYVVSWGLGCLPHLIVLHLILQYKLHLKT
jgi:hypothetical protein